MTSSNKLKICQWNNKNFSKVQMIGIYFAIARHCHFWLQKNCQQTFNVNQMKKICVCSSNGSNYRLNNSEEKTLLFIAQMKYVISTGTLWPTDLPRHLSFRRRWCPTSVFSFCFLFPKMFNIRLFFPFSFSFCRCSTWVEAYSIIRKAIVQKRFRKLKKWRSFEKYIFDRARLF